MRLIITTFLYCLDRYLILWLELQVGEQDETEFFLKMEVGKSCPSGLRREKVSQPRWFIVLRLICT